MLTHQDTATGIGVDTATDARAPRAVNAAAVRDDEVRAMLNAILECTQRIQALIETGEWLGAAQADAQRQRLLVDLCARIEPRSCPPALVTMLAELVTVNEAMLAAVGRRQDALLSDAQIVGVGRKAVAAYGEVGEAHGRF